MGRPVRRAPCEAGSPGKPVTRAERRKVTAVAAAAAQAVEAPVAGLVLAESLLVELLLVETAGHGEACSAQLMSGGMRTDCKAPVEADQAPREWVQGRALPLAGEDHRSHLEEPAPAAG